MTNTFKKQKTAGILMIIGGVGHLIPSLIGTGDIWSMVRKEGWWNKIPPPWTSAETVLQKAFWVTWGSFALPFILLGALSWWLARQQIQIPKFIGFALLGYGVITITLVPAGGMWVFLFAAILLLSGKTKE